MVERRDSIINSLGPPMWNSHSLLIIECIALNESSIVGIVKVLSTFFLEVKCMHLQGVEIFFPSYEHRFQKKNFMCASLSIETS